MDQKPDYYQVLGVAKTASLDEIKKAHARILMSCHPDKIKLKVGKGEMTPVEAAAAEQKYKDANEGIKVLQDSSKRSVYDRLGHKGLESLAAGKSTGGGGYTSVTSVTPAPPRTEGDTFAFFDQRREMREREERLAATPSPEGLSGTELRERAREARKSRRGSGGGDSLGVPAAPSVPVSPPPSTGGGFNDVSEKTARVTDALKEDGTVPLGVLQRFRQNLADLLGEVDNAISRAKNNGPKP